MDIVLEVGGGLKCKMFAYVINGYPLKDRIVIKGFRKFASPNKVEILI